MSWIYIIDLLGTCIFAISGVTTAIHKKFDLVGTLVIGFVTAIGGGTIRDILIGSFPVGWMNNRHYLLAIFVGYVLAYAFKKSVLQFKRGLFLFDTVGIGLFTVMGIEKALSFNLNWEISLILGVISACFGGVIRDVLANEVPLIFRKEIYATACLAGGIVYLILIQICPWDYIIVPAAILTVSVIRYLSIKYEWQLTFND